MVELNPIQKGWFLVVGVFSYWAGLLAMMPAISTIAASLVLGASPLSGVVKIIKASSGVAFLGNWSWRSR
jgi:uncharacterized membrane protein HdeD (DUF308 family)